MDELVVLNKNSKCSFCGIRKNDHLIYGPIYKLGNIKAHYYCVLLSNRLIQNGNDDEGILGFLLSDILNELERTSDILCVYCNKGNATIKCAAPKCRKSFHLPCGLQSGSLHQFTHQFKSFCHFHRPIQNIPGKILKEAYKTRVICCICYDNINVRNRKDNLWAPCCLKTWYHRYCVQKLAHSAGYFFRCATCNNVQKFNKWMQRFGIFVPQQDASWELVPHAFEELLFRYNKCDAEKCKCPQGRNENTDNTMWEIILCQSCGSQGIHVACGNLKFVDPEWECPACQKVTNNLKTTKKMSSDSVKADAGSSKMIKLTEICQKKRRRDSDDLENSVLDKRKKRRANGVEVEKEGENEVDVETIDECLKVKDDTSAEKLDCLEEFIDVESEEVKPEQNANLQEVLSLLKPGPLSYKLALIQTYGNHLMSEKSAKRIDAKKVRPVIDLIELSDLDGKKETNDYDDDDDDIQVIKDCRKQTPEKGFDLIYHYKIKKENENQNESSDKNTYLVKIAKEPEKQKFLVVNVTVLCTTSLQSKKEPLNIIDQRTFPVGKAVEKTSCDYTKPLNYFSMPREHLAQYPTQEVLDLDRPFSKTDFNDEEKELVKASDDEVIVLSD